MLFLFICLFWILSSYFIYSGEELVNGVKWLGWDFILFNSCVSLKREFEVFVFLKRDGNYIYLWINISYLICGF